MPEKRAPTLLAAHFHLSGTASLAVEAAFRMRGRITAPGAHPAQFAGHLTDWLVEERLLLPSLAPYDFQQVVRSLAADRA